jgi:hypothetical protein
MASSLARLGVLTAVMQVRARRRCKTRSEPLAPTLLSGRDTPLEAPAPDLFPPHPPPPPQYSLYPDALVPAMVGEVNAALTWMFDHAAAYGGDPAQVSLVGHSAGAQLCTMALLHRAAAAHAAASGHGRGAKAAASREAAPARGADMAGARDAGCAAGGGSADTRMPARLIGMAGVYDIAKVGAGAAAPRG